MKRIRILGVVLIASWAVACGGQESTQATGSAGESLPEVATQPDETARTAGEIEAAAADAAGAAGDEAAAVDSQEQSCLDLVAAGEFREALPICTAALQANPTSQTLKDAVAKARTGAAGLAEAPSEAADAAAGLGEGLPQ